MKDTIGNVSYRLLFLLCLEGFLVVVVLQGT
jgi:hypothetical protein